MYLMYRNYKIFNASVYFAKTDMIFKYQLSILLISIIHPIGRSQCAVSGT